MTLNPIAGTWKQEFIVGLISQIPDSSCYSAKKMTGHRGIRVQTMFSNHKLAAWPQKQLRVAFSLIELSIVVVIMSILAAVALPRWSDSLNSFRAANAASRIAADLALARSAAYSSSTSTTMTFDVSADQYTIEGITSLNHSTGPYVVALADDPYKSRLVSVWGLTGQQSITFDGYGRPNAGGTIVIASGNLQKSIVVNANSGTAVVQ
jgi:prepilin-type N-terminal cleavage/methylation domain-containing protein